MCAREGRTVLREVDKVRGMLRRARRDILMGALSFRFGRRDRSVSRVGDV